MLGVRRLLVEHGMPLSSRLCTMSLDTLNSGDGCIPCDREDDLLTTLLSNLLTALLSKMSMSSITCDFEK